MYRSTNTIKLKPHFQKFICDQETPISLFHKFAQNHDYAFLFESAEIKKGFGQYSFIGFDPLLLHIFEAGAKANPLHELEKSYENIQYENQVNLPNFQGGFVGYFSYEVVRHFESLNLPIDKTKIPEGIFYLPKNLLIFDHFEQTLTLIVYNEEDLAKLINEYKSTVSSSKLPDFSADTNPPAKTSTLADHSFEDLVLKAKENIVAGEVFQIVLSQEFTQKTTLQPLEIYRRLRKTSPTPYMYFLKFPEFSIIGSSPETLVKIDQNEVIIHPIAGTRRRGKDDLEDQKLEEELKNDIKEKAEHMMLVDLGRNDLGKIAIPGTIKINNLMSIQKFDQVMHMVSEIIGTRDPKKSIFDVFQATFPAGTLTGAPKVRAMEIIAKLEKVPRGIYGGAVGYFGFNGNMDFAIAIRTMLYKDGQIYLRAGAGIVYDSLPKNENSECQNKAKGPLKSLTI